MNITSIRIKQALDTLMYRKIIPESGLFDITEKMLSEYIKVYGSLDTSPNNKRKYNKNYARKMAGLWLLKLNLDRGGNTKSSKEGLVYVISNPAWPEHVKIGMTVDLNKRLASYQMYDPLQQYSVKNYEFVLDRRNTEKSILNRFGIHLESGEWIKLDNSTKIIDAIRFENNILSKHVNIFDKKRYIK